MTAEVPPGRPGNLTPEQEEKLRQLWSLVFRYTGVKDDTEPTPAPTPLTKQPSDSQKTTKSASENKKRGKLSFFGRKAAGGDKDGADTTTDSGTSTKVSSGTSTPLTSSTLEDDKYGQTRQFLETLANQSPESIRATIWSMVKHDHPDSLLLRFLRARKWDVERALVMMISTMNWRATEMHVDDDIMLNGEAAAVAAEQQSDDPLAKILGHDFLAQIRMGKSFLHGTDRAGRPICVVRVRLHRQGEQKEESLERYTVYIIETARMLLVPPIDTATILFDMTGFSMANMDYTPVKFMIKCFEANYPESLGVVLVHKAPWIFQGIWRIIKGWLDPVVAAKVNFTNNAKDLEEFIAPGNILRELEGQEAWEYQYVEPMAGENDKMADTATRDQLLVAREALAKQFETATLEWIQADEEKRPALASQRNEVATGLRSNYWVIDPYIRARSLYDRTGIILPGGKVNFYPAQKEPEKAGAAVPAVRDEAVQTSAADLD